MGICIASPKCLISYRPRKAAAAPFRGIRATSNEHRDERTRANDAYCICRRFSGDDESFAGSQQSKAKGPIVDSGLELGVVVQGRTTTETRLQGGKAEEEQEEEKKEEKKEKKEKEKEEEEVRGGKGTTEQSQTKDAEATVATTKEDAANDTNEHDVASREDGTDSTDSTGNTDSTGSTDKPSHARQGRKGPMPKL